MKKAKLRELLKEREIGEKKYFTFKVDDVDIKKEKPNKKKAKKGDK